MSKEMVLRKIPENMRPWECYVNGVKYVYPAGTEQNVPEEVAHLIDAWYAAQEQESVPGGGGSVVEIPITWDDAEEDFTVGKTFAEMREAIDSGSTVVLKDNWGSLYYLHLDEGEYLSFTNIVTNMNSRMVFGSFGFSIDRSERYYSETVTTQEDFSVTHAPK